LYDVGTRQEKTNHRGDSDAVLENHG
jgi:hypothetical protein